MKSLRQSVSELMVIIHLIDPELADFHVSQMDDVEVYERFQHYTGMELSAVGPHKCRPDSPAWEAYT